MRFQTLNIVVVALLIGVRVAGGRVPALEIGPARATVSETVLVPILAGTGEILISGLPPALDLASLRLIAMDDRVRVEEWRPLSRAFNPAPDAMSVLRVGVHADTDLPGARLHLTYLTGGLSWSAHYQLRLPDALDAAQGPVTGEVQGIIRIYNNTGRAWSNATVSLVSGAPLKPNEEPRPSGFLMIDGGDPLSDLWTSPRAAPELCFRSRIPDPISLPPRGSRVVPWCRVTNCVATTRYRTRLGMEDLQRPRPLSRWIEVKNFPVETPAIPAGEIMLLPAPTEVLPGILRVEHTESGGSMSVDLGPDPLVTARRESLGRTPGQPGYREETFALTLTNGLSRAVDVEITDTPPVVLEWDVTVCTHKYQRAGKHLVFRQPLAPGGSELIRYTLRVRETRI